MLYDIWLTITTQPPRGGGGTLILTSYVALDPASTVHPKKYQEFQAPQKIFEINFSNPQKYPPFYTLTLRKDHKMHRPDPLE